MQNSGISNRTLIKYVIIIGLIYVILKMVPAETLGNKDMMLILAVIIIGFICLECLFKDKSEEDFANMPSMRAPGKAILPGEPTIPVKTTPGATPPASPRAVQTTPPALPRAVQPTAMPTPQMQTTTPALPTPQMQTTPPASPRAVQATAMPTPQMRAVQATTMPTPQMRAVQATTMPTPQMQTTPPASPRAVQATAMPTPQMKAVQATTMPPRSVYNEEVNEMKKQLQAQITELRNQLQITSKQKVNNDFRYNELPADMYTPIGDKVANNWSTDNEYNILNSNQWQVPMPRPPVCINTEPCKVCPSDGGSYLTLKNWDQARVISENKINQRWASDQGKA
jgi:hypothetical protein